MSVFLLLSPRSPPSSLIFFLLPQSLSLSWPFRLCGNVYVKNRIHTIQSTGYWHYYWLRSRLRKLVFWMHYCLCLYLPSVPNPWSLYFYMNVLWLDRPNHKYWASKSVSRHFWTTEILPIFWFWGSLQIVKGPVGSSQTIEGKTIS